MGDLISRQALCEYALNQKDKSVTPNDIMRFPSAQPDLQPTCNQLATDTISRQAALDAVLKLTYADGAYGYTDAKELVDSLKDAKELVDSLEALPSAQPEQRWIPVEEHLPKQNEMVLITIIRKDKHYNKIPFISIGYINWNNTTWWCACKSANVEVLAWMPLPEPYKEEE